jgi:hypothetical protein
MMTSSGLSQQVVRNIYKLRELLAIRMDMMT